MASCSQLSGGWHCTCALMISHLYYESNIQEFEDYGIFKFRRNRWPWKQSPGFRLGTCQISSCTLSGLCIAICAFKFPRQCCFTEPRERKTHLHQASVCTRLPIQILTGNNSQSESQFWCKLQQSGTAGFWMSCVAAVAPAVDCVKRPGSGRKGQKGEGGPNFKTNFLLFSHSAHCTCSHRLVQIFSTSASAFPTCALHPCRALLPAHRAKSFEVNLHVGVESLRLSTCKTHKTN